MNTHPISGSSQLHARYRVLVWISPLGRRLAGNWLSQVRHFTTHSARDSVSGMGVYPGLRQNNNERVHSRGKRKQTGKPRTSRERTGYLPVGTRRPGRTEGEGQPLTPSFTGRLDSGTRKRDTTRPRGRPGPKYFGGPLIPVSPLSTSRWIELESQQPTENGSDATSRNRHTAATRTTSSPTPRRPRVEASPLLRRLDAYGRRTFVASGGEAERWILDGEIRTPL